MKCGCMTVASKQRFSCPGEASWKQDKIKHVKFDWVSRFSSPRPFFLFDYKSIVYYEFLLSRPFREKVLPWSFMSFARGTLVNNPGLWAKFLDFASWKQQLTCTPDLYISAKNNTIVMPQPPFIPDMTPCDFFLFPKMMNILKEFCDIEEVKAYSLSELKKLYRN